MSDTTFRLARLGEDAAIIDFINANFDMRLPLLNRPELYHHYYAGRGGVPQFAVAEQDGEYVSAAGYILANTKRRPDIWVSVWVAAKSHNGVGLELMNALPGAVAQGLVWGIMAIGVYLTYRILDVADLTVDGSFGTGGAVCVMCLLSGQNVWVSLLAALVAGLATGFVTGLLHTFMGIPAILAGILTQLALYSINLKIMGKANQSINVDKYDLLISLRWVKETALHNPIIMVLIVTAVVIGILYWFFGTELGCGIRATGSNPAMSRAQGINTNFNIVLGLAVSNGLVALSGALLSQYQGFSDVSMGRGAIVIGLAAVIIGEALFGRIFHNFALKLLAVSLGAIIYYIVIQLVLTLGFDANLLKLLSASVVAIFLAVPYWKGKYFAKPAAKKAQKEGAKNA